MPTAEVGNSKDKSEDRKCWLEQGRGGVEGVWSMNYGPVAYQLCNLDSAYQL